MVVGPQLHKLPRWTNNCDEQHIRLAYLWPLPLSSDLQCEGSTRQVHRPQPPENAVEALRDPSGGTSDRKGPLGHALGIL